MSSTRPLPLPDAAAAAAAADADDDDDDDDADDDDDDTDAGCDDSVRREVWQKFINEAVQQRQHVCVISLLLYSFMLQLTFLCVFYGCHLFEDVTC